MTPMPDIIAKTRIFNLIERFMNESSQSVLDLWRASLDSDFVSAAIEDKKEELGLSDFDHEHLMTHVFGKGDNPEEWWLPDNPDAITTEGMALTLDLKKSTGLPVEFWWLCPATNIFRYVVAKGPRQLTVMILTPPKKDHTEHYRDYEGRNRLTPEELTAPAIYNKDENLWVVSMRDVAVTTDINNKRLAQEATLCSFARTVVNQQSEPLVRVMRPLAEPYYGEVTSP